MLMNSNTFVYLQIYSTIDKKIDKEDGPELLEYIFVAFSIKPNSQKIFEQVIYNFNDSMLYLNCVHITSFT